MLRAGPRVRRLMGGARHQRQRGISLIELLVGVTIGLMVIGAAIGTLLISRNLSAAVSDASQLQQQGSYALRTIGLQLRQAGSRSPVEVEETRVYKFDSFSGFGGLGPAVSGTDGTKTDVVSVSNTSAEQALDTQRRDCLGDIVSPHTRMDSTFTVNATGALTCRGIGSGAQQLISNVAGFQAMYRVATPGGLQIMTADEVTAAGQWAGIKAIEICLDLQGRESLPDAGATYRNCAGVDAPRGQRLHMVFRNVFDLRTQSP